MNALRTFLALSITAVAAACASPGDTNAGSMQHATMTNGAAGSMGDMQPRMKAMHEMHQKMMAARTPAERQALMPEHMKAMQGGMAMMKEMHGGPGMQGMGDDKAMPADMAMRHRMMTEHMAAMQMMMEMMSDRMPPAMPSM